MLFGKEPRLDILKDQIVHKFQNQEATIHEIEEFVITETAFRETHYKKVLKEIEQANPAGLEVIDPCLRDGKGLILTLQCGFGLP